MPRQTQDHNNADLWGCQPFISGIRRRVERPDQKREGGKAAGAFVVAAEKTVESFQKGGVVAMPSSSVACHSPQPKGSAAAQQIGGIPSIGVNTWRARRQGPGQ